MTKEEEERLLELYKYDLLDTEEETEFDDIVKLASQICEVPISLISLVDDHRQWFKAKIGVNFQETPREHAFCAHAINHEGIMEVENALNDSRFYDNPLVVGAPYFKFYAGMPLVTPNGYKLGTLCVIDNQARSLTAHQKFTLKVLSNQVVKLFELRLRNYQLGFVLEKAEELGKMAIFEIDLRYDGWNISDAMSRLLGMENESRLTKEDFLGVVHPEDVSKVKKAFLYALNERTRFDQKFRIVKKKTEEEVKVKLSLEIVKNEEQEPVKLVGVVYDISESLFRENILINEIEELKQEIKKK